MRRIDRSPSDILKYHKCTVCSQSNLLLSNRALLFLDMLALLDSVA